MNITILLQAFASLSWLAVIALIAIVIIRASRGRPLKAAKSMVLFSAVLAFALSSLSAGLVFIQPQERGVVISAIDKGIRQTALQPGLNWVFPYMEAVIPYSISRQTYTMSISASEGQIRGDDSVEARTSDGQIVRIDASVIFAIDPTRVVDVHIKWQNNYVDNLIRPQSRGIIRDAVSQFGIEEVYSTKRYQLTSQISDVLKLKLEESGIILVDFVLRNVAFSDEYAASVEQKQISEQQAQQAGLIVEQRKQEAEQVRQTAQGTADAVVIAAQGEGQSIVIKAQAEADARLIQAEAEAKALQMIAAALKNNPDLLTFEYIDKLSPGIKVMLVPNNNPYLLPIPSLDTTLMPSP